MNSSNSQTLSVYTGSTEGSHDKALPPLTSQFPQWSRGGKLGIDSIYQKPFQNERGLDSSLHRLTIENVVNKKGHELAAVGRSDNVMVTPIADPLLRIAQLEQNLRFLQEQHQLMLSSLHQEVEQLRHKNRDLQFQLVFNKGGIPLVQSTPSSPEDDTKRKIILSPKQVNVTPLQVELLEKEITELKSSLHEAKTKNIYLSAIVEEQRKKLESLECGKIETENVNNQPSKSSIQKQTTDKHDDEKYSLNSDLASKLEEAEQIIRRLQRDNEEHRRELVSIKTNLSKNVGGAGGNRQLGVGGGNNGHRGGGNASGSANNHHRPHSQQSQTQRFPPLHSQSYWHHGQHSQHRSGIEFVSHRHCANGRGGASACGNASNSVIGNGARLEKDSQLVGRPVPSLPNLRNNSSHHYTFSNGNNNNHNHRRGGGHYNGNSNHYYRGGKSGGRGNREAREPRETK